jgi:hypothetical protein
MNTWYQELNQQRAQVILDDQPILSTLGEQAEHMSYIVNAHIQDVAKAERLIAVMENNTEVANKFKERIYIWNGLDSPDFRQHLARLGYKAIYRPINYGYQLGFLDLCRQSNEAVTNPYLQMNGDIKLSPVVLEMLIDTRAELNCLPSISCLHQSRSEYGPMGQFFVHTPTKGFAQYDGPDPNICSEYVLRDTCQGHQYCIMDEPMLESYESFIKQHLIGDSSIKNIELGPYGITHWHFNAPTIRFL